MSICVTEQILRLPGLQGMPQLPETPVCPRNLQWRRTTWLGSA